MLFLSYVAVLLSNTVRWCGIVVCLIQGFFKEINKISCGIR